MSSERIGTARQRAIDRLRAAEAILDAVDDEQLTADTWIETRAAIGLSMAAYREAESEVDRILGTTGSRNRMRRFFQLHLNRPVSKEQLSGVAGVLEWARRVRELRQDEGWLILSDESDPRLKPGEYRLVSDTPAKDRADIWRVISHVRMLKSDGLSLTSKARTLEFLKRIYPRRADASQLVSVAGDATAARSAIESIRRDGWQVVGEFDVTDAVGLQTLDRTT